MVETREAPVVQAAVSWRLWTRAEYVRMIDAGILREGEKSELIAGAIITKVTQNSPHATAVGLGDDVLRAIAGEAFHVPVQLPLSFDPDSEPEPELAIIIGTRHDYRAAHPTSALPVVEIADSSLASFRGKKASIYARAGIADY